MVDNLKSCNLQGTAADTDTNANECRSHYGTLLLLLLLFWTFVFVVGWASHTITMPTIHNVCSGHCYAGMQQQQQQQTITTTSQASLKAWPSHGQAKTQSQNQNLNLNLKQKQTHSPTRLGRNSSNIVFWAARTVSGPRCRCCRCCLSPLWLLFVPFISICDCSQIFLVFLLASSCLAFFFFFWGHIFVLCR